MHIIEIFYEIHHQKMLNSVISNKKKTAMNGASLKESLVYYATISCNDKNYKPKLYKGNCETSFKKRYSNHKKSVNVRTIVQT